LRNSAEGEIEKGISSSSLNPILDQIAGVVKVVFYKVQIEMGELMLGENPMEEMSYRTLSEASTPRSQPPREISTRKAV
jgi:hypothetical protein